MNAQSDRKSNPDSARRRRLTEHVRASTGMRWLVLVMFALAVLLIVLLAAGVLVSAQRYRSEQQWLVHTYQVQEQLLNLRTHMQRAEMEARSYGLTGNGQDFSGYWRAVAAAERALDTLASQSGDRNRLSAPGDATQAASVQQLKAAVDARRAQYEKILTDYSARGADAARADVLALIARPGSPVGDITGAMLDREASRLNDRQASIVRKSHSEAMLAVLALGGSLLLLVAAFISVAGEQRRRVRSERRLANNAERLEAALAEAERAGATLRNLSTLTELLQNCRDVEEALNVTQRALPPLLPGTSGSLALINASHNLVEARMGWGSRRAGLDDAVFAPDDCWALRRNQPHPARDDASAPVCAHLAQAGVADESSLCLPLTSQGQVLGVLSLSTPVPLAPEPRRLAITAADQLALAIGNLRLQASLRTQSIRDPLTNLFNRRYLEASMPRELLRAERRKGGLSLLMFDIDHFKRYNDTQGHEAGDALLASFGALLAQSCRGEDMPCRIGGEEFAVVLTDADHPRALERAEHIRREASELLVTFRGSTLPPATVSIGVSSYPEHGDSLETLRRTADKALYNAKHAGRNQVASAGSLVHPDPSATAASP